MEFIQRRGLCGRWRHSSSPRLKQQNQNHLYRSSQLFPRRRVAMWSLICSMLLAGLPASIPDSPVWTIAADGSMVELFSTVAPKDKTKIIEIAHPHGPGPVTKLDLPRPGTTLKRLPGPAWWHCPTCGSSTCLMYLGQHLRGLKHEVSHSTINRIEWGTLRIFHDNLHNRKMTAKEVEKWKKDQAKPSGCKDGRCNLRQRRFTIPGLRWRK